MPESIEIELQRAIILLAEELSYPRAAERLNIAAVELRQQISDLEEKLCLAVFRSKQTRVEVTEEGKIFLRACLEFVALSDDSG